MGDVEVLTECVACGGRRLVSLPVPGRWTGEAVFASVRDQLGLCRCSGCGLVFVNPRPAPALLDRFYQRDSYDCHLPNLSEAADHAVRAQLDLVEQLVPAGGRFLDFGCGGGGLLRHALERGWQAVGYDIGAGSIAQCRSQGLPVTDHLDELGDGGFDAIYLSHVFEHIGEPGPLLRRLRALLAPAGRLILEVPNAHALRARLSAPALSRWAGFDERYRAFPVHLFYYSASSLRALVEHHDLDIVARTTTGIGLEELRFHEEGPSSDHPSSPRARHPARGRLRFAKQTFLGLGLGENLVVAAARAPAQPVG
jgi:SAM-dependent methyltransferase